MKRKSKLYIQIRTCELQFNITRVKARTFRAAHNCTTIYTTNAHNCTTIHTTVQQMQLLLLLLLLRQPNVASTNMYKCSCCCCCYCCGSRTLRQNMLLQPEHRGTCMLLQPDNLQPVLGTRRICNQVQWPNSADLRRDIQRRSTTRAACRTRWTWSWTRSPSSASSAPS